MTSIHRSRRPRRWGLALLLAALVWAAPFSPAAAQYGGGPSLFVDPVQVPIDGTFDAFGFGCAGGSTVTITIDGIAGTLGSTTAADDSSYRVDDIVMPAGVVAGDDYTVRASCGGTSATVVITALCNDLSFPVDGVCPDGRIVGGGDPTATTTTSPGGGNGGSTTTAPGSTAGGPGPGGDNGSNLAVTGASTAELGAIIGATLVGFGAMIVLVARRRDDAAA